MSHYGNDDEDDDDRDDRSHSEQVTDTLRGLGGVNERKGTLSILGLNLPVGKVAAPFLKSAYDQILNKISREGSRNAFQHGYDIAKRVGSANPVAYKVARTAEFLWGFGPTIADVGLNVKKSVRMSYTDMREVRESLAPYLAANHNMNTGLTALMSDTNDGVRNLRAFVMKKSKNSLMANFADFAARIPSLALIYWNRKLDDIQYADRARSAFANPESEEANARVAALEALREPRSDAEKSILARMGKFFEETENSQEYQNWARYQTGNRTVLQYMILNRPGKLFSEMQKVGDVKMLFKQITNPKHANELQINLTWLNYLPAAGGLISQFLTDHLVARDNRKIEDFAVVKAAALAARLKKNPPDDPAELSQEIHRLFRQQFSDSGHKGEVREGCSRKLSKLSDELAMAIVERGLNPYALIDLVCGNKLVKMEKGELVFSPTHERAELIDQQFNKYNVKVDNKQFWHDAGVKPEDVKKIYATLPEDERGFFVMLFPPGVLEQLGVDKRELERIRDANRDEFIETFSKVLTGMKDYSTEELTKKYGVPEHVAKLALSAAEDYDDAMRQYGRSGAERYLERNQREVGKTIVETILASRKPADYLAQVIKKGNAAALSPAEIDARRQAERHEAGEDRFR